MDNASAVPRKKRRWWLIPIFLLLFLALLAAAAWFYDGRHAELEVLGQKSILLEYGQEYQDAGARATSTGRLFGDLDTQIDVYTYIPRDLNELGEHEIRYFCTYLQQNYEDLRIVKVVDRVNPKLELTPSGDFNATPDGVFQEPGFRATDNHDGDITARVVTEIRGDTVYYSVKDESGNEATAERQILYAPSEPVIKLLGGDEITVEASMSFEDPGFRAYDENANDVSAFVTVEGEVTPYLAGEYELTYTLETGYGEPLTAVRKVYVTSVDLPASVAPSRKTIYLTFDDGPGPYTEQLLDILKMYKVKATFFVTAQNPEYLDLIAREYAEGHTVAVHTYSHDYNYIYSGVEEYVEDFLKMRDIIYEQTGEYTNMFRFPGGSSNTISSFNPGIMTILTQAMPDMGYKAFDWNVPSGDAGETRKSDQVYLNVINGIQKLDYDYAVVLQHDIKEYSVNAVERIIIWGLNNGYVFAPLDMTAPRTPHAVFN